MIKRSFILFVLVLLNFSVWSQKIVLKEDVYIDYLALKVTFGDSITQENKDALMGIIEAEIEGHNRKSKDYNVYLVSELKDIQKGIEIHIDRLQYPSIASHHNTFYFSLLWPVVSLALVTTGSSYFVFWFAFPLSELKNSIYLTPSLSVLNDEALKHRILANAGWFKSEDEIDRLLFRRTEKSFGKILRQIDSKYRAPKEYRKKDKIEMNLPTRFRELTEINSTDISEGDPFQHTYPMDSTPIHRPSRSTFDMSLGLALPVSGTLSSSFDGGASFLAGPKWISGKNSHISFLTGIDVFAKQNPEQGIYNESLYNIKLGMQLYYDFPLRNSHYSIGPYLRTFFNMGNYQYNGTLANETQSKRYLLVHRGFSAAIGMRWYFGNFFTDLNYHFYAPNFHTDGGHDYPGFEFPQRIDISTIELSIGVSLRKSKL